jgi:hypothetical protein
MIRNISEVTAELMHTEKQNLLARNIWSVVSKNSWFLRQRTKFFETTDFSVKSTDKSVRRTVSSRLERKPNFPVTQQILFFGVS